MRMIAVKQAISMMENAATPHSQYTSITLLTAKKDRSVSLAKDRETPGLVTLKEQGYEDSAIAFDTSKSIKECKHAIKQAFKREFPRSHKVYVSTER